ncbi:hypothetical protein CHS0354_030734 [Potamilus streckersoni]|uniref:Uncharacterized protein n=1 Tax=Potamilus streckersoni TaxID=2493646 RepID=A0AAE0SMM2_9BIVA|nr:hypothetical protein CHS0354_030734 [Potamilus streckersoni]
MTLNHRVVTDNASIRKNNDFVRVVLLPVQESRSSKRLFKNCSQECYFPMAITRAAGTVSGAVHKSISGAVQNGIYCNGVTRKGNRTIVTSLSGYRNRKLGITKTLLHSLLYIGRGLSLLGTTSGKSFSIKGHARKGISQKRYLLIEKKKNDPTQSAVLPLWIALASQTLTS